MDLFICQTENDGNLIENLRCRLSDAIWKPISIFLLYISQEKRWKVLISDSDFFSRNKITFYACNWKFTWNNEFECVNKTNILSNHTRERRHAMFLEHKGLPLLPKSAYIDGLGFGFFAKIRTMVAWVVSENERFKGHILSFHEATNAHMYTKESVVFWRRCFNVSYVQQNITYFVIQMVNNSYLCIRSFVFNSSSPISFVFSDLWCGQFLFNFFC